MNQTNKLPKHLYHYTSIHSLACILKSKKIRFTKLSSLNDPLEGKTEDLIGSEHLVFCSSWTAHEQDSIPLWKMYTDFEGVRIKMPPDMYDISGNIGSLDEQNKINSANLNSKITIKAKDKSDGTKFSIELEHILGPDEVKYKCHSIKSVSSMALKKGNVELIDLSEVGIYKNKDWSYEKEWRYRVPFNKKLFSTPISEDGCSSTMSANDFSNMIKPEENYIDIPLKPDSIDNIEVMLGPCCQKSHEIIVLSLLEKFTKNHTIKRSEISVN